MAAGDSTTSCCTSLAQRGVTACDLELCLGRTGVSTCTGVIQSCSSVNAGTISCALCDGNASSSNTCDNMLTGCWSSVNAITKTVNEPDNYWQRLTAINYSEFLPTNGSGITAYATPQSGKSTNFSSALAGKSINLTYAVKYWYRIPVHKTLPYQNSVTEMTNTKVKNFYTGTNTDVEYTVKPTESTLTYNYTDSYFTETVDHDAEDDLEDGYFSQHTEYVWNSGANIANITTITTNANKAPLWPTEYININFSVWFTTMWKIDSVTFKFPANHDVACPSADVTNNIHWTLYCVPSSAFNTVSTRNLEYAVYTVAEVTDTWNINNPSPTVPYNYTTSYFAAGSGMQHQYMFCVKVVIDNYLNQGDFELWQLNVLESTIAT